MVHCKYCRTASEHPLFVYLIKSEDRVFQRGSRTYTKRFVPYIGISRHPFLRLKAHNRERHYRGGAKGTTGGAPDWTMVLMWGPFWSHGMLFKESARSQSRKIQNRVLRSILSAARWGVDTFVIDEKYVQSLLKKYGHALRKHPPGYNEQETRILQCRYVRV